MHIRLFAPAMLATAFAAKAVCAQQISPAAVQTPAVTGIHDVKQTPPVHRQKDYFADGATRLALSAVGSVGGAYMGGAVASTRSNKHDLDRLGDEIGGAIIGSALASAMLGSMPTMHSHCDTGTRMMLGLLGSVVGSGVGMAVGAATQNFGVLIFAPMIGAPLGTTIATNLCGE